MYFILAYAPSWSHLFWSLYLLIIYSENIYFKEHLVSYINQMWNVIIFGKKGNAEGFK